MALCTLFFLRRNTIETITAINHCQNTEYNNGYVALNKQFSKIYDMLRIANE